MEMTGTIINGTVVLDQPCPQSEGLRVVVRLVETEAGTPPTASSTPKKSAAERLAEIAKMPHHDGPVFSGRDHDRILYGPGGAR